MSIAHDSSRRFILKLMVSGTAGLMVGCASVPNKIALNKADDITKKNDLRYLWLHITTENDLLFYLDRVEMGQGILTSHCMIVAEALGVNLSDIKVSFAPVHQDFNNPEFSFKQLGIFSRGLQMTGGSTSVSRGWRPLMEAATELQSLLIRACSSLSSLPDEQLMISGKYVTGIKRTDVRYPFSTLIDQIKLLKRIPSSVSLEQSKKPYKLIGKSCTRLDARKKSTGLACFGIDIKADNMLTAVVLRSPMSRFKLAYYDESVITDEQYFLVPVSIAYSGVAVVSGSYWQSHQAVGQLKKTAKWILKNPTEKIKTLSSEQIHKDLKKKAQQSIRASLKKGTKAHSQRSFNHYLLADNGLIINRDYHFDYLPHATMEPMNCTVLFDRDSSCCEIWAPTQYPSLARVEAMNTINKLDPKIKIKERHISIHTTLMGGGFGRRIYEDFVVEAVEIAVKLSAKTKMKIPVKVIWTREDDFKHDYFRPPSYHKLRGRLTDKNELFWEHRLACSSVMASDSVKLTTDFFDWIGQAERQKIGAAMSGLLKHTTFRQDALEGALSPPYGIDQFRLNFKHFDSPLKIGFWRSVGHFHNAFVVESFIDELAAAYSPDIDPLRFRLERYQIALQHCENDDQRQVIERLQNVLLKAKKCAKWEQNWGQNNRLGSGIGVAVHACFGSFIAMIAQVCIKNPNSAKQIKIENVDILNIVCAVDCGFIINPDIVQSQVEGSIVFGLSAALKQKITVDNVGVRQSNFHDCDLLRMHECPKIKIVLVDSEFKNYHDPGGIGEPVVPVVAPAVANAIANATGNLHRPRSVPFEGIF